MPNGGSDCCGSCWFNARNKGEAGFRHIDDPGADFCTIRGLEIKNPFWTYCNNHPWRRPERDPIPLGPVFIAEDKSSNTRRVWLPSPDTEEIRQHLFELACAITEQPAEEYPIGIYTDEMIVWQLGEFREVRAAGELERIASFSPQASAGVFGRTRASLVAAAKEALKKMGRGAEKLVL